MKKIISSLLCFIFLTSCSNQKFYNVNSKWSFSLDNISYSITYTESSNNYISLKVAVNDKDNKVPLYVKTNKNIEYVECDGIKYSDIKYERYLGELEYHNNEFDLRFYFL